MGDTSEPVDDATEESDTPAAPPVVTAGEWLAQVAADREEAGRTDDASGAAANATTAATLSMLPDLPLAWTGLFGSREDGDAGAEAGPRASAADARGFGGFLAGSSIW